MRCAAATAATWFPISGTTVIRISGNCGIVKDGISDTGFAGMAVCAESLKLTCGRTGTLNMERLNKWIGPHGLRCFIGWCNGHGQHMPGLWNGWLWR